MLAPPTTDYFAPAPQHAGSADPPGDFGPGDFGPGDFGPGDFGFAADEYTAELEKPPANTVTWPIRFRGKRIPTGRLLMVLNQLAVMTQNGIDLSEAVATAAKHARNPDLAERLDSIHQTVNSGGSFSAALQAQSDVLPPTLPAMIAAAESAGQVPQALGRICLLLRNELQLRGAITGALIYPIILVLVSFAVMLALLFGVLPQFGEVFGNLGRPMPASTEMLLAVGKWCRENMLGCGLAATGSAAILFAVRNHPQVRVWRDWMLIYCPLIRHAYRPLACGRMFRLLGTMLAGGLPLLEAIRLTQRSLANGYLVGLLERVEQDVLAGETASRAFVEVDYLPAEAAQMVITAERTGRLAEVLTDCGQFYEEHGERVLRKLVHSLEPIIILVMGVLVAGVVLSIMLPLLDISSVA